LVKVYSKALDKSIEIERQFVQVIGKGPGPTVIVVSGIHGNEPSGIFAMKRIAERINPDLLKGNIFAFAGNLNALSLGERYLQNDLNRLWTDYHPKEDTDQNLEAEDLEQHELYHAIKQKIEGSDQPVYIIDLHTTSSKTLPFLTLSKHEPTLTFCEELPLPKVKNIDDFVKGAFFTHMNKEGYIGLGFEAGQHDAMSAIDHHEHFILSILNKAGMYKSDLPVNADADSAFYKIKERFVIDEGLTFQMKPGYSNFQPISKGEVLATYDENEVLASQNGKIFLPLYQSKGNDGFFIIEKE